MEELSEKNEKLHLQQGSESVEGETQKEEESLKPEDEVIEVKRDEVIDIKNDETTKNIAKIIRPEKPTSIIKSHFIVNDVLKFIEEMKLKVSQEDDEVRIIPSHSACRFELPVDMSKLKDLTPFTYLVKFCRADESRRIIYETQFDKYRNNKGSDLLFLSDIRIIYENLFHEETLADELLNLRRLLDWDLREGLDKELFVVVSCLMERIIVRSKGWNLEKGFKRNDYEYIEFYALNGKLHGIEINSSLHHLLEFIRNA